tara:strand:- start:21 stop:128 length:108 start_codon:yes stop_codon:yes gene_type:complete
LLVVVLVVEEFVQLELELEVIELLVMDPLLYKDAH